MKKVLIAVSFTVACFGCNNHSDHGTANTGTDHTVGHDTTTGTKPGGNDIREIMNNMMQAMHSINPMGNNDVDFARMMVMHHEGAVEMSRSAIAKGSDTALKVFAQTVITDQGKEIRLMEELIAASPKIHSANAADFQKAMNNSMMAMMKESTLYNDIDKDYAAQMIPHHQSAVDMARAYLAHGKNSILVTLCNNIISSQTREINWLTAWLNKSRKQVPVL
jgi:uncharacterized protein (DUF305 family)